MAQGEQVLCRSSWRWCLCFSYPQPTQPWWYFPQQACLPKSLREWSLTNSTARYTEYFFPPACSLWGKLIGPKTTSRQLRNHLQLVVILSSSSSHNLLLQWEVEDIILLSVHCGNAIFLFSVGAKLAPCYCSLHRFKNYWTQNYPALFF